MPPQATDFGATKAKKRRENRRKNRPKKSGDSHQFLLCFFYTKIW
jgi:hypothetical protein